jgi:rubrerythrin
VSFNPLEQQGIPIDEQFRSWRELSVEPLDSRAAHPYTQCRVIVMNGIEVEAVLFGHQLNRHTDNPEIRRALAMSRRVEQQQQKAVNWLLPPEQSTLETTIMYEQVAVDLTAYLARTEPDPYQRQVLEFGLLEDFDHLYRYADLYELSNGRRAEELTDHLTEIMPGRPTQVEHRHPVDELRAHMDKHTADPLTKLHALTITAAEQQTMNFYMNTGPQYVEPVARALFLEIAEIEEQHVTQYESLLDPTESWFEQWVLHEYNEVYMYHSFMADETDQRVRAIWELHLNMEIEQLKVAAQMMRTYAGMEAAEILPPTLPVPTRFEPNKAYVRQVLAEQVGLTAKGPRIVPLDSLPADDRYYAYRDRVNDDWVPSEIVIEQNRAKQGREYRDQTEGDHPVIDLREPAHTKS